MTLKKAKKATKESLKEETLNKWKEKIEKLVMQGDFIKLLEEKRSVWHGIALQTMSQKEYYLLHLKLPQTLSTHQIT